MTVNNKFMMNVSAKSANESFARACISAFAAQLDPTLEEVNDIKTAVSEAVTNCIVHAYREKIGKIYITGELLEGNIIRIKIRDTGCGIPEKYRESIFQPFFRVDKSRSRENGGVGLGLALVWEIVALHGGEIRVEESSEKGTTVAVKLPTDMKTKLL